MVASVKLLACTRLSSKFMINRRKKHAAVIDGKSHSSLDSNGFIHKLDGKQCLY